MASLTVIFLLLQIVGVKAPISSKWSECSCRWEPWAAWSSCTATCGGGTQDRDRMVWKYITPNCEGFEACASNDMGWERQACNTQCFNGGTFHTYSRTYSSHYGYCSCPVGKIGSCCEESKDVFINNPKKL